MKNNINEFFKIREEFNKKSKGVDLSLGIPSHKPPKSVMNALRKIHIDSDYSDPAGLKELRELIARSESKNGINLNYANVFIALGGASGGLGLTLKSFFKPGDEILIPDPFFPTYISITRSFGLTPILIDTYDSNFSLDFKKFQEALTSKTKGILINNPNNPTGKVYSKQEIINIVNFAKQNKLFIISDEVYCDFVYDHNFFSPIQYYPEGTIALRSFSKTLSLIDFRLGYVLGSEQTINKLTELQFQTAVCPPLFLQKALVEIYKEGIGKYIKELQFEYKQKRDFFTSNMTGVLNFNQPQGAFYLFAEIPEGFKSSSGYVEILAKEGLLVMPGGLFSKHDTNVRIAFANPNQDLKKAIKTLKSFKK